MALEYEKLPDDFLKSLKGIPDEKGPFDWGDRIIRDMPIREQIQHWINVRNNGSWDGPYTPDQVIEFLKKEAMRRGEEI